MSEEPQVNMTEAQWEWFQEQERMRTAAALDASNRHRLAMDITAALLSGIATSASGAEAIAYSDARRLDDKRDAAANAALIGLLASPDRPHDFGAIVNKAWQIADDMMEARK